MTESFKPQKDTPSLQVPKAYLRYISLLEKMSFKLAAKEITRRFFSPIPYKTPLRELPFIESAECSPILVGSTRGSVHILGEGKKVAVFIHGWSGRGSQVFALAPALVEAGFKVYAITAPAHGNNPGKTTHMLEFADTIKALFQDIGKFDALIAHSIGGAAAINAVAEGVKVDKLVILGAPSSISNVIVDFCNRLHLSERYNQYISRYLKENYHSDVESFSPMRVITQIAETPGLIIHDKEDIDVNYREAERLHNAWPNSQFLLTKGLGHRRILNDPKVIQATVDFILS